MRDTSTVQPSGRWYHGWTIVAVLVLSQVAANSLTYNSFPQFVPVWAAEMHALPSRFQLSIMAMLVGAALASVIVGAWADKYPARRLFGTGLIGMAVFFLGVSFATLPWQIIALYGLVAAPMLTLCTAVTANALISRWFVRRLGTALGISTCGVGLASTVLPKLVAHFLPEVGWRMIWRVGAVLVVAVVMPIVVMVIRDRPSARHGLHYLTVDGTPPLVMPHGGGPATSTLTWREIMGRRNFWLLVVIYLVMIGTGTAFIQNMGVFAKSRGLGLQDTGTLIAVVGVAHVFAALGMGALADRFGNRLPLAGMALAVAAGIGFLAIGHSLPALALGAGLIGLNAAVFTPLSAGIATEFGAAGFGRAFGLAMLFLPFSQIFPYLVARQQELTGSYLPAMAGCATALVIIAGLSLMLHEKGRGRSGMIAPAQAA
jgi:MFS family permease